MKIILRCSKENVAAGTYDFNFVLPYTNMVMRGLSWYTNGGVLFVWGVTGTSFVIPALVFAGSNVQTYFTDNYLLVPSKDFSVRCILSAVATFCVVITLEYDDV